MHLKDLSPKNLMQISLVIAIILLAVIKSIFFPHLNLFLNPINYICMLIEVIFLVRLPKSAMDITGAVLCIIFAIPVLMAQILFVGVTALHKRFA